MLSKNDQLSIHPPKLGQSKRRHGSTDDIAHFPNRKSPWTASTGCGCGWMIGSIPRLVHGSSPEALES